jgi:hypothetical protein
MKKLFALSVVAVGLLLTSCGNNDCPSGVNTTNPNCPNYSASYYSQPTNQYPYSYPNSGYPYNQSPYGYPNQQQYPYGYPH